MLKHFSLDQTGRPADDRAIPNATNSMAKYNQNQSKGQTELSAWKQASNNANYRSMSGIWPLLPNWNVPPVQVTWGELERYTSSKCTLTHNNIFKNIPRFSWKKGLPLRQNTHPKQCVIYCFLLIRTVLSLFPQLDRALFINTNTLNDDCADLHQHLKKCKKIKYFMTPSTKDKTNLIGRN